MKTALLAQNDNLAIDSLKKKVGRSVFDLSHSVTFPIDVDGAILPICCVETVPSDSFEISCECLLRQLNPLKVPLMTNIRLNTAFYYCSNRLGWKKFDRFMQGGRSGNETYDIPRVANVTKTVSVEGVDITINQLIDADTDITRYNTLHTYFGISLNHTTDSVDDSEELPLAFPFFDYQLICRDFYTDVDRLAENYTVADFYKFSEQNADWAYKNLFPEDDDEFRLIDGIQIKCGFVSGDDTDSSSLRGCLLDKVRYHNVRDDYFTTSKKAPMRGDEPSINITQASGSLDFSKSIHSPSDPSDKIKLIGEQDGKIGIIGSNGISSTSDLQINTSNNLVINGGTTKFLNSSQLKNALEQGVANIDINAHVTAADLRLLSQLTVWKELNILHKPYYNDFLNAHFENVKVGDSQVEKPQFIGGTSQIVHINEIIQTSESSASSPLGHVGATAMSLENNYVGKYFCPDYGYIIGVVYLQPEMIYKPALPRNFSRRTKEDFYSPEFANLSMQAILNKEIFFSSDSDWNNTAWGYTGAFDEMRSIPNRAAGELLNDSYSDITQWILTRSFTNENKPSMSTEFLSLKGNVDKTAWSVPLMPAFILQAANYIKAIRPMPYVAIPKAL